MLHLHVPSHFGRLGRLYDESDHGAWVVLVIAVATFVLIIAAFMGR